MKYNLPDWLILYFNRVLLGEIYPKLRAVALQYSSGSRYLLIRYYLDRKPTDFDYESISVVEATFGSSLGGQYYYNCDLECVYSTDPMGKLDCLDGFIYARREYDLDDNTVN